MSDVFAHCYFYTVVFGKCERRFIGVAGEMARTWEFSHVFLDIFSEFFLRSVRWRARFFGLLLCSMSPHRLLASNPHHVASISLSGDRMIRYIGISSPLNEQAAWGRMPRKNGVRRHVIHAVGRSGQEQARLPLSPCQPRPHPAIIPCPVHSPEAGLAPGVGGITITAPLRSFLVWAGGAPPRSDLVRARNGDMAVEWPTVRRGGMVAEGQDTAATVPISAVVAAEDAGREDGTEVADGNGNVIEDRVENANASWIGTEGESGIETETEIEDPSGTGEEIGGEEERSTAAAVAVTIPSVTRRRVLLLLPRRRMRQ